MEYYSDKKDWTIDIYIITYSILDETQGNYAEWKKKPDLKRIHILWVHSYEILEEAKQ